MAGALYIWIMAAFFIGCVGNAGVADGHFLDWAQIGEAADGSDTRVSGGAAGGAGAGGKERRQ